MQADEGIIYGVRLALCDPTGDFLYYFGRTRNPALVGATYEGGEFLPAVRSHRDECRLSCGALPTFEQRDSGFSCFSKQTA